MRTILTLLFLFVLQNTAVSQDEQSDPKAFVGLWETKYGHLRIFSHQDKLYGRYLFSGFEGIISGQIQGDKFEFEFKEPNSRGTGWFKLSRSGAAIRGKYLTAGTEQAKPWKGKRVDSEPGKIWLVVFEANWEESLGEPQYAFADMLESYFKMSIARHVQFRKRIFHDGEDLMRLCRELKYLPGPVYLLISTHGNNNGITVNGETIHSKFLADSIRGTSNLRLLHLSGCSMMSSQFPEELNDYIKDEMQLPISGYKTAVRWDSSAIADFTYMSLVCIHRMRPELAVRKAIKLSPYIGEKKNLSPQNTHRGYDGLGLSILVPKKMKIQTELIEKSDSN
ncbi:MAG: hypothetical protein AAGA30_01375 [Planctomycetota bacterium]